MPRYSDRAVEACAAMFANVTYGLGKRCAAINVEYGSTAGAHKWHMPVNWINSLTQKTGANYTFPFFEAYSTGSNDLNEMVGTSEYEVGIEIRCWMSKATAGANQTIEAKKYRMLESAIWELINERPEWEGRCLADSTGRVTSVYSVSIEPIIGLHGDDHTHGIGAMVKMTAVVEEEDQHS